MSELSVLLGLIAAVVGVIGLVLYRGLSPKSVFHGAVLAVATPRRRMVFPNGEGEDWHVV